MAPNSNAASPRAESRVGVQQASVPISVYRELASELQAARAQLESLSLQNQELVRQNQRFRVEIEATVRACARLKQVTASLDTLEATAEGPLVRPSLADLVRATSPPDWEPPAQPDLEPLLYHQQEPSDLDPLRSSEVGSHTAPGWLQVAVLVAAALILGISAFGVSFLLWRPSPSR